MGKHSTIEWTDHTFNPWWGCEKVSPACTHCYAETWARRVGQNVWGRNTSRRFFSDQHWREPLRWQRDAEREGLRRRVFCASMADVFEVRTELDAFRDRLWLLIEQTPLLDWLLLTKRPEHVRSSVPWTTQWPENVWLGTTAEDQQWYERRVTSLTESGARTLFLSCEPLLGPIRLDLSVRLHWVIVGGESGAHARAMHPMWARELRDQCNSAQIAFFFKQWGEWAPTSTGPAHDTNPTLMRVGKKAAGRQLDGQYWNELPLTNRSGVNSVHGPSRSDRRGSSQESYTTDV